jgi:hypothetical protein
MMIGRPAASLGLWQQFKPGYPRHVDVREDQDQGDTLRVADELQCRRGGQGKFHDESVNSEVAPKLLPKQDLDVWLVVDHEDEWFHVRPQISLKATPHREAE